MDPIASSPPPDRVHVWYAYTDRVPSADFLPACYAVLSPEELDRAKRFRLDEDRRDYAVAHAVLRATLARYVGAAPSELHFTQTSLGKPSLAAPFSPLAFSLSHTRGLAVVAVAATECVGVDAEDIRRHVDVSAMKRFFAPPEIAQLASWSGEQQQAAFFSFWTLKEAYVKARGLGLTLPLDRFAFALGPDGRNPTRFTAEEGSPGCSWFFDIVRPDDRFCVAVVAQQPVGNGMQLCFQQASPIDIRD